MPWTAPAARAQPGFVRRIELRHQRARPADGDDTGAGVRGSDRITGLAKKREI